MSSGNLIVVGVDGSDQSRRALVWALDEAVHRSMVVLAVIAWTPPPNPAIFRHIPAHATLATERGSRVVLHRCVEQLRPDYPTVSIRERVVRAEPVRELVKLSEHAAVVVVGARPHPDRATWSSSVSVPLVTRSACTVVVVR